MPSKYRNTFFDEPRDASLIKLRVLQKYLSPWIGKLGYAAHRKRLCVVDGFAGPGEYSDGTPGSPRLILDAARNAVGYDVRCVFVEKKPTHARRLKTLCASYADVDKTVIQGDFRDRIDQVVSLVEGRPLLALIDPFGVKDLDLRKIGVLVNSTKKADLVVTFADSAAARLAGAYPADVATAIGVGSNSDYAGTFARNMAELGSFLTGGRFPIHQSFDAAKKYELIVFSRSFDAYELWNDSMTREWRDLRTTYTRKEFQTALPEMGSWAEAEDARRDLDDATSAVREWCRARSGRPFLRREMIRSFVVKRFASFHTSTLKSALRQLEAQGELISDSGMGVGVEQRRWQLSG